MRTLLALASINFCHLHQLDVNSALFHVDLHEEVYMSVPQGVTSPTPTQVCKLLKFLYGLKHANRKWYESLASFLITEGYKQSTSGHSLFILHKETCFMTLLVYVDDVILANNRLENFHRIIIGFLESKEVTNSFQKFFRSRILGIIFC